jgi:hypothetical protein
MLLTVGAHSLDESSLLPLLRQCAVGHSCAAYPQYLELLTLLREISLQEFATRNGTKQGLEIHF